MYNIIEKLKKVFFPVLVSPNAVFYTICCEHLKHLMLVLIGINFLTIYYINFFRNLLFYRPQFLEKNDKFSFYRFFEILRKRHPLLLTQILTYKKTVTGFRYPRACRIRIYQIENKLWKLPLPTFFKCDFFFITCC
jgi:hypothetical protein